MFLVIKTARMLVSVELFVDQSSCDLFDLKFLAATAYAKYSLHTVVVKVLLQLL